MQWTVTRRITAGFAGVLVLMGIVVLIGLLSLGRTAAAYEEALAFERTRLVPVTEAQSNWRRARVDYLRLVTGNDPTAFVTGDSLLAQTRQVFVQLRDSMEHGPADRSFWGTTLQSMDDWRGLARSANDHLQAGRPAEARRVYDERMHPAAESIGLAIRSGIERVGARTDSLIAEGAHTAERMRLTLLLGGLLAIGVGGLAAIFLNRAVSDPLRETTGVLASSAAEILAATTQQASGASESSASVTETMSTVEEVTQTAQQAAERARTVADSARRAADIGRTGQRAVEGSVGGMTAVREQVEAIAASILTLAEQAQAIGEIIATVNDIAEQTNLLALNAAVEAARAGEHGRGFAVVASEVKNLAQQSKKATVQVRQILGEIQRATSGAVMNTEQGTRQVASTERQVQEAGETIRTLAEAVAESAQAAAQIMASAGQQALGMTQIREAMANIHETTQQNLASTKQAERAAHDLNALGLRLLTLTGARA